jgi:hypothetical protein
MPGGGQVWTYAGEGGETVTITTVAEWDTTLELLLSGAQR